MADSRYHNDTVRPFCNTTTLFTIIEPELQNFRKITLGLGPQPNFEPPAVLDT
jgi:hypothetical protein